MKIISLFRRVVPLFRLTNGGDNGIKEFNNHPAWIVAGPRKWFRNLCLDYYRMGQKQLDD